jgi:hypothetical protein
LTTGCGGCCSPLVHHTKVIALKGDSYRLKDRDLGRVPAAGVVVGQRVQADVVLAAQMLRDDGLGQRQIRRLGRGHALAPVTMDARARLRQLEPAG